VNTREFILKHDASNQIVTQLLIMKFGETIIQGLLADDYVIEPNRKKGNVKAYVRDFKSMDNVFDDGELNGERVLIKPDSLLMALDDAREAMNYSNWAADKFDRIGEIVIRYCMEHNIEISFREDEERVNTS
jgi:hypothetical protein